MSFGNGKSKHKVEISIFLEDSGHVGVNLSSHNIVTVLGMIETAKNLILDSARNAPAPPESPIIVPRFEA